MDRREFIKVTAITGTTAALASCGSPEDQLIRFIPDEEIVPGVAVWKPSVCPLCPAGCGLHVRVMDGDAEVVRNGQPGVMRMGLAKKLEGNPGHPINQGKLCVRGQAGVQVTYHPDRITGPLKRVGPRGGGQFQSVSWDEGLTELLSHLDELAAAKEQKSLAFLTRPRRGVRHELVTEFLGRFGAGPPIAFELFGEDVLRRANGLSFGREQLPTFDLSRARYVLSFGADFLGTWNSPVAQNAAYGAMRQGRPGVRGKFVQVEQRMSQTGANADEWVPVKPGTEGVLALGLAHVIVAAKLRPAGTAGRAGALIDGWSAGLTGYSPAEVEKRTGVPAARIERLARELAAEGPAVVLIGGTPLAHTNGLFHALAVNALNELVGSVGQPGGVTFMPQVQLTVGAPGSKRTADREQPGRSLEKLCAEILAAERSPVQLLMIEGSNPVFATPPGWRVRDALQKIPFIVSFGNFTDETSTLADLVLPDHSFLESWVEGLPESGAQVAVANLAPPAVRPLHQTRAMPDVLLDLARRLRQPLAPQFPETFEEVLQAAFAALPKPSGSQAEAADDPWTTVQAQGGWWGAGSAAADVSARQPVPPATRFADPQFDGDATAHPFHFLPYASSAFLDGSLAHLPWLQEVPDALSTAMWSSWVEINPKAAERLGIGAGDLVEVASRHGTLRAAALLSPGIAPDVIAMPVGQGHQTFTRYASGRGENPISLLGTFTEAATGSLAWAATRVQITRVGDRDGRLILFAGETREKPHEHER